MGSLSPDLLRILQRRRSRLRGSMEFEPGRLKKLFSRFLRVVYGLGLWVLDVGDKGIPT